MTTPRQVFEEGLVHLRFPGTASAHPMLDWDFDAQDIQAEDEGKAIQQKKGLPPPPSLRWVISRCVWWDLQAPSTADVLRKLTALKQSVRIALPVERAAKQKMEEEIKQLESLMAKDEEGKPFVIAERYDRIDISFTNVGKPDTSHEPLFPVFTPKSEDYTVQFRVFEGDVDPEPHLPNVECTVLERTEVTSLSEWFNFRHAVDRTRTVFPQPSIPDWVVGLLFTFLGSSLGGWLGYQLGANLGAWTAQLHGFIRRVLYFNLLSDLVELILLYFGGCFAYGLGMCFGWFFAFRIQGASEDHIAKHSGVTVSTGAIALAFAGLLLYTSSPWLGGVFGAITCGVATAAVCVACKLSADEAAQASKPNPVSHFHITTTFRGGIPQEVNSRIRQLSKQFRAVYLVQCNPKWNYGGEGFRNHFPTFQRRQS